MGLVCVNLVDLNNLMFSEIWPKFTLMHDSFQARKVYLELELGFEERLMTHNISPGTEWHKEDSDWISESPLTCCQI